MEFDFKTILLTLIIILGNIIYSLYKKGVLFKKKRVSINIIYLF